MKLIPINSRESCHVLALGEWDVLFSYGDPVAAFNTKLNILYQEDAVHSLSTGNMIDRFLHQCMKRMPPRMEDEGDEEVILINRDSFASIVAGTFECST